MLEQLEAIKERFDEIAQRIVQPEAMADQKRFSKMSKEYKDLDKVVQKYQAYKKVLSDIDGAKELIATESDEEMRDMAKAELIELQPQAEELEATLKEMLIPKDPYVPAFLRPYGLENGAHGLYRRKHGRL